MGTGSKVVGGGGGHGTGEEMGTGSKVVGGGDRRIDGHG